MKSETISKIAPALVAAQSEMGNAIKDSTNPFFKSKYADLNSVREACIPIFNKHKIVVLQPTVYIDGKPFVETMLLHESGEFLTGVTEIVFNKQNDAQAHGSGVTYARRYGLQSFANIGCDDDDGNSASAPAQKQEPKKPFLEKGTEAWKKAVDFMLKGGNISDIKKKYQILEMHENELTELNKKP
jgi:hypothetical protein